MTFDEKPSGKTSVEDDYFVKENGETFAGKHILLELWEAKNLNDPNYIDQTLRAGALAAGATVLHSHVHHFTPSGGVTGVLLLAESHMSIHTWPERDYAAVDIFMCGACDPEKAIAPITQRLSPKKVQTQIIRRGII